MVTGGEGGAWVVTDGGGGAWVVTGGGGAWVVTGGGGAWVVTGGGGGGGTVLVAPPSSLNAYSEYRCPLMTLFWSQDTSHSIIPPTLGRRPTDCGSFNT